MIPDAADRHQARDGMWRGNMRRMGRFRALTYAAGFALLAFPALAVPTFTITDLAHPIHRSIV